MSGFNLIPHAPNLFVGLSLTVLWGEYSIPSGPSKFKGLTSEGKRGEGMGIPFVKSWIRHYSRWYVYLIRDNDLVVVDHTFQDHSTTGKTFLVHYSPVQCTCAIMLVLFNKYSEFRHNFFFGADSLDMAQTVNMWTRTTFHFTRTGSHVFIVVLFIVLLQVFWPHIAGQIVPIYSWRIFLWLYFVLCDEYAFMRRWNTIYVWVVLHLCHLHSYLRKDPAPVRKHCKCVLTVEHMLCTCSKYEQSRTQYFPNCHTC